MLGEGSGTRGLALSGPPGKPWASRACVAAVLAVGGCLHQIINRGESTETWRQERVSAPLLFALLRTSQPRSLRKARSGHETSRGAFLGKHSACCNRGSSGRGFLKTSPPRTGRLERSPDVTARNRGGNSPRALSDSKGNLQSSFSSLAFPSGACQRARSRLLLSRSGQAEPQPRPAGEAAPGLPLGGQRCGFVLLLSFVFPLWE